VAVAVGLPRETVPRGDWGAGHFSPHKGKRHNNGFQRTGAASISRSKVCRPAVEASPVLPRSLRARRLSPVPHGVVGRAVAGISGAPLGPVARVSLPRCGAASRFRRLSPICRFRFCRGAGSLGSWRSTSNGTRSRPPRTSSVTGSPSRKHPPFSATRCRPRSRIRTIRWASGGFSPWESAFTVTCS